MGNSNGKHLTVFGRERVRRIGEDHNLGIVRPAWSCLVIGCLFWLILLLFSKNVPAQSLIELPIQIKDEHGKSVARVRVAVTVQKSREKLQTAEAAESGELKIQLPAERDYELEVTAAGFTSKRVTVMPPYPNPLVIILAPASLAETITIAAARTEQRIADVAASVTVLSHNGLVEAGAQTIDDALRNIPGFTLFRRTSSRVANPTAQGVSLRGIGPSGASRTAVLYDGMPLNDPFGGWIYWARVPRLAIDQIEVVRGGASQLYGTDALGGVISFRPRPLNQPSLEAVISYGNRQTPEFSLFVGTQWRRWEIAVDGAFYETDGYTLIAPEASGLVDQPANSEHRSLAFQLGRQLATDARLFARGQLFKERRDNGTPLQKNDTGISTFTLGSDWQDQFTGGAWQLRAYGGSQLYHQTFSAIAATRNSEQLTRTQRVPAQQIGASLQWQRSLTRQVLTLIGLDGRQVRGLSDEIAYGAGRATSQTSAGGRQRIIGTFGQVMLQLTNRFSLTAGGRLDHWRNYAAASVSRPLSNPTAITRNPFTDKTESAFSPKLGLVYHLTEGLSWRASGYRAFRAPTLNELYRGFRVGNVVTLANSNLRAERLTGGETGLAYYAPAGRYALRGTMFWSEMVNPVANVTLSVTPNLITRQRANLGRTRSRGLELEAEWQPRPQWSFSTGYALIDATVRRFPADLTLEQRLIPQVPRHHLTGHVRYSGRYLTASTQIRYLSRQFDDDRNEFPLAQFVVFDAYLSHPLKRGLDIFAAAENLFDTRYAVGRTPIETLGLPRLVRVGLRLRLGD